MSKNFPGRLFAYNSYNRYQMDILSECFIAADGPLYEIKPAPGKGLGMFAINKIKKGTEILREDPMLEGLNRWFSLHAKFNLFSDEKKVAFMALHSQCNCGKEICEETDFQKIWDANSFEVTVVPALSLPQSCGDPFVYLVASRINHDCGPNTGRAFTAKCQIVFQASKDIQAGEEITTDYTGLGYSSVVFRRQLLLKKYQFTCTCQSCARNLRVSKSHVQKANNLKLVPHLGLPVLGELTALEALAFSEADNVRIPELKHFIVLLASETKYLQVMHS